MNLDQRFRAFRLALLKAMGNLTPETDPKEVRRVNGMWKRLRQEVTHEATKPGEARRYLAAIWETPEWGNFDRLRSDLWKQTEDYKRRRREYARTYYQKVAKTHRARPEVREQTNRRRRERYRLKKPTPPEVP
jgi:hypothetical protein